MYSYPYTDKDTFTKEYFVHKRDSVMKANIPGFKEGVYMSTDSLLTDVRPINVQNSYTMEARGLWRMKATLWVARMYLILVWTRKTNELLQQKYLFIHLIK